MDIVVGVGQLGDDDVLTGDARCGSCEASAPTLPAPGLDVKQRLRAPWPGT